MTANDRHVVKAENLTRSFRRGAETVHALRDFSLEVAPADMVAIVGRSGSGKTTFLNQVGCLDRPTSGRLWIAGQDVTQLPEKELVAFRRDHIGFVFQLFYLIPTLTALENVMLPAMFSGRSAERQARELCERVGLGDKLGVRPNSLAGGDRQRVAIARALINEPRLLLADEPTGRLESEARDQVLELFNELRRDGLAVIMATHDLEQASRAQRIIELSDGRIAA
jgi:ABC-type lipoprotein export system ATPase subunit